jgi:uncharacterized protein (DUF697 family)
LLYKSKIVRAATNNVWLRIKNHMPASRRLGIGSSSYFLMVRSNKMVKRMQAEEIVRGHILWAMGGGLMPLPGLDFAAVTAVQMDMLRQLSSLYEVDFSQAMGKNFVTALTGTTLAKLGASALKVIPGVGTIVGGLSMSLLSGASTYALGQIAIGQLETHGGWGNIDLDKAKAKYQEWFEKGKEYVANLEKEDKAADILESIEKLGQLREQGAITEEEFEAKKKELLARL